MSNEAHNKTWTDSLDALDHVPGQAGLDKEAAWNRLHTRLQHKKSKRTAAWYRVAAACLLAAALLPLWLKHTKNTTGAYTPPVVTYRHSDTPAKLSLTPAQADIEPVKEITLPALPATTGIEHSAQVAAGRQGGIQPLKSAPLPVAGHKREVLPADTLLVSMPLTDTLLAITESAAAPAAPVKKMRVIHINELGTPAGQEIAYPRYKPFSIRINGPANLGNQAMANSSLNIHLPLKN